MTAPPIPSPVTPTGVDVVDPGELRPLLAALPVLLLGFDVRGVCVLSEGGLLGHLGLVPGGDVGTRLDQYFVRFPESVNAIQRALAGETLYTRALAGPVVLDLQWHPRRDPDDEVVGVLVCARAAGTDYDAESVARAEQAYRALLSAVPDQLFRLDRHGRATVVKPASDPDGLQLPVSWSPTPLADVVPRHVAATLSAAAETVLATATEQLVEAEVGLAGCLEARLIPESDEQVLGIVRDVTRRRQLEAERREASKLEALGRLSAGVAHEINTPIQFVSHNVEFMRDAFQSMHQLLLVYRQALHGSESMSWEERSARLQEQEQLHDVEFLLGEVPQAAEDTLDGIRRVGTIVHALKQFSHPSARELRESDVNDALRNAVVVATNEHKHVADVELDLAALPPVVCDPGELTQVFLNLIVNAAHALEPAAEAGHRGRIVLTSRVDGDVVVVAVRDDGPGISSEDQERIFDAFFTTKEVGKGTGQGLTLARAIIADRHGGELTFRSVLGEGTTFEVRVPIAGPSGVVTAGAGGGA